MADTFESRAWKRKRKKEIEVKREEKQGDKTLKHVLSVILDNKVGSGKLANYLRCKDKLWDIAPTFQLQLPAPAPAPATWLSEINFAFISHRHLCYCIDPGIFTPSDLPFFSFRFYFFHLLFKLFLLAGIIFFL